MALFNLSPNSVFWADHPHPAKKDKLFHGFQGWHMKSDPSMFNYSPDVDLRETATDYFLDPKVAAERGEMESGG